MNNSYYFQSSLPVFFIVYHRYSSLSTFYFLFFSIDVIYVYDRSTPYLNMERYIKECHENE